MEILEYNFNKVNKHPDPTTLCLIAAEAGLSEEETQVSRRPRSPDWHPILALPFPGVWGSRGGPGRPLRWLPPLAFPCPSLRSAMPLGTAPIPASTCPPHPPTLPAAPAGSLASFPARAQVWLSIPGHLALGWEAPIGPNPRVLAKQESEECVVRGLGGRGPGALVRLPFRAHSSSPLESFSFRSADAGAASLDLTA